MAEADRVVAGGSAGRPPRRLGGEQCGRFFPVVEVLEGERGLPPGYAGCVAEDVTHLDVLLAVGGEFRPVLCDRREGVEQPAVDQDQSGQGGHVLGARKDVDDGVFGPLDGFRLIGIPAPDVDDQLAVDVDRNGGTQFPAGVDLFSQRGRDVGETVVATANDHAGGGKGVERVGSHWVSFLTQGRSCAVNFASAAAQNTQPTRSPSISAIHAASRWLSRRSANPATIRATRPSNVTGQPYSVAPRKASRS